MQTSRIACMGRLGPTGLAAGALVLLSIACNDARNESDDAKAGNATTTAMVTSSAANASTMPGVDFKSVAARVIGQSAGVGEGDMVFIGGTLNDLPLLEDMAIEVRRRGGHPLVSVGTEALNRRMYDEVPAKYDAQASTLALKLAGLFDVFINMEAGEGRTLAGVAPERVAAQGQSFAPLTTLMQKRGVRTVGLGNNLYPTDERADLFKMPREELAKVMYGGIDLDYSKLQASGEALRSSMAGGRDLRITSANGTDLKVSVAGRPVLVSDGVISPEDRRKGGAATSVWLPAGEVYVTPVPGTAEGVVVADHVFVEGKRIDGLRLEIKRGKMVSMTAKSDLTPLQTSYDAAGAGRDVVGVVDIGINPELRVPGDAPVNVWSRSGAVTVAIGGNTWAGGDNAVAFGLPVEVPKATVTLDGKELVKSGTLAGVTVTSR